MIQVVAAILERNGTILIGQRQPAQSHPLKWEFPGGKVEPGETPAQAVARELAEELDIRVGASEEVTRYFYSYPGKNPIELIFLRILQFDGEPRNLIFHDLRWESRAQLPSYDFVEGDIEFLRSFAGGAPRRKSTPEEIRHRFDHDVERFSNLETGQSATIDAPLGLELIAGAAAAVNPGAAALLDIGCGAGNYTLKLMSALPLRSVTLIDLSKPMLDRAVQRISAANPSLSTTAVQSDIREAALPPGAFDIAVAAATLHHLRGDDEWNSVFASVHRSLKPGGSFWIWDLVAHEPAALHDLMWSRYGDYLTGLKDTAYRDHVFAYVDAEDTPRPLAWQLEQLRAAGFRTVEVLHMNTCFAAFGAIK